MVLGSQPKKTDRNIQGVMGEFQGRFSCLFGWVGLGWVGLGWVHQALSEKISCLLERSHVHQVPKQQGYI